MSTSTRVIKNTGYLYIKMGITVFVSLYTTRLILASLGASDFGIFNIVGGAIAMLGFLNSTLANATQRYMSYAEGEGNLEKKRQVFNVSIVLHFAIALVTVLLLLGAMYPLFHSIFNIDHDRIYAAKVVFICLIFSTFLTIINVPYDAVMTSHENMLYYSIVGVFESLLKLAVAFICVKTSSDKLVVYGILMALIPLITLSIMKFYCHHKYSECVICPKEYWDRVLVKNLGSFFGWNFLTAISSLFTFQGIGLVLNHFFGTLLNAAQGIANQVNSYMSTFSSTMLRALNPVITKSAGAKDIESMNKATMAGCKYSTLLIMFFAIPCMIEIKYVLSIWLNEVPEWAEIFCVMQLAQTIIIQMAGSASTAIYAEGNISYYAICKSVMNIMPLFIVAFCFAAGGSPVWLYIPMIAIWAVGGNLVIIYFARKNFNMSTIQYFKDVVFPIVVTIIAMLSVGYSVHSVMGEGFLRLIAVAVFTAVSLCICTVAFASMNERMIIKQLVINLLGKTFHKNKS